MPNPMTRPLATLALALMLAGAPAGAQDGVSGAYLAARVAESEFNFSQAARWYAQAYAADRTNPRLLFGLAFAQIGMGDIPAAAETGRLLKEVKETSQAADFALLADEAAREDYEAILTALKDGRKIGPLVDDLSQAWAEVGAGRMSNATAIFDRVSKTDGAEAFGLYHKALALASVGDFEGADNILSGKAAGPITVMRSGVLAHVQILSQLERNPDAIALLDRSFGTAPDKVVDALRARLAAGEPLPFDAIKTAKDGIAEVFFTMASALRPDAEPSFALIHARIAAFLRPTHAESQLLTAELLEELEQYDLAVAAYSAVAPTDPVFHVAEIGRAQSLYEDGQKDPALEVLRALARSHADVLLVQTALGDALRRSEKFEEAIRAYDASIALVPSVDASHWGLFFSRGIAHEQLKQWDKAEPDFRKALELNPDQPQVLNYLGYSFVDRGENLDEALSMIERAVAAEPNTGYIIDSLAWAYFRLGRYADALEPMEKASLLEPVDPVVTDHLGDVYWAVGRTMEARFQWRRALSFDPVEKEANRIRRKLEIGLDAVLQEEGAPALKPVEAASNGG